ncbi:MAG: hypothetical protein WAW30_06655 [Patescibacteria group bacterium]
MKRKILLLISVTTIIVASMVAVFSSNNISRMRGSFSPVNTWTGGHPGVVLFDIEPAGSGYTATRDQYGYLTGFFWLGNV